MGGPQLPPRGAEGAGDGEPGGGTGNGANAGSGNGVTAGRKWRQSAVQVAVTEPPRDDHRDLDAGSHWEQQWHLLQDGSAAWDADEGDAMGPGKGIKCRVCVSLVKKVQKIVGDDPDEDAINDALNKVCSTGRRQRSICKQLLKKLRQQLSDALQNNDDPRDVCTTLGLCKG